MQRIKPFITIQKWMACIALVALTLSCEEIFLAPEPLNTPERNFEIFWSDYDRYYSYFELKHLNWDSMYKAKRPLITSSTNSGQLLTVFNDMIQYLRDGHADLNAGSTGQAGFNVLEGHPVNRLSSVSAYVSLTTKSKSLSYGVIQSDIGYIAIKSFAGVAPDFTVIDEVLAELKAKKLKGIIVDIRGNGGGSDQNSSVIAKRFADGPHVYSYYRYKTGPAHSDFGAWSEKTIEPEGERYTDRVIVLTNRAVFSAAEDFVLAMRPFPTVTILGDTTGGGSGNPLLRTLPNGWTYRVPRWQQVDAHMNFYENIGLAPDIAVWITPENLAMGNDTILERAIEELN
jgi:carboxyl-terminal processing protease